MSAATDCNCNPCNPAVVSVPGTEGATGSAGADGTNGVNGFTYTDSNEGPFDKGDSVEFTVLDTTAFPVGAYIAVAGVNGATSVGYFFVSSKSAHQLTTIYLDIAANLNAQTIVAGNLVVMAGPQFVPGALPAAMTDNSTGAASATIAAGVGVSILSFPIQLAAMTTAAADLLTNYIVGFAFKILSVSFVTTTIGAGAAASQVINLEINTTNVTGGVVTIALADTDTLGELKAGTAVTANNTGTATDTLSVEVAAGGTVFTSGNGILLIRVQNMDTAGAAASFAANFNTLRTALS